MASSDLPCYFRLLNPPSETKVVERARFPTIIALGEAVKAGDTRTAAQFVSNRSPRDARITRLKGVHDRYMNALTRRQTQMAAYLFDTSFSTVVHQVEEI